MDEIPVIHINTWPSISFPATVDDMIEHDRRLSKCKAILTKMTLLEKANADTPEGWKIFLDTYW